MACVSLVATHLFVLLMSIGLGLGMLDSSSAWRWETLGFCSECVDLASLQLALRQSVTG